MQAYRTKTKKLTGSDFHEVRKKAFGQYLQIKKRSKRKPYIRSAYFNKDKIFLDLFWDHLFEKKHFADLMRRMKFYPCAIELVQQSKLEPISKENPNKTSEILHRFGGITSDHEMFFVQIKEDKKSCKKWLISVFPIDKQKKKKTFRWLWFINHGPKAFFTYYITQMLESVQDFFQPAKQPFAEPKFDNDLPPVRRQDIISLSNFVHARTLD